MNGLRLVGRIVMVAGLLAAAVAALVIGTREPPTRSSLAGLDAFGSAAKAAMSDWEANEESAEGAPQQAVVNGWVARDLLLVIAEQDRAIAKVEADVPTDDRPTQLLLVGVLALCWLGAWIGLLYVDGARAKVVERAPELPAPSPVGLEPAPVA